jgi:hypothetical protein
MKAIAHIAIVFGGLVLLMSCDLMSPNAAPNWTADSHSKSTLTNAYGEDFFSSHIENHVVVCDFSSTLANTYLASAIDNDVAVFDVKTNLIYIDQSGSNNITMILLHEAMHSWQNNRIGIPANRSSSEDAYMVTYSKLSQALASGKRLPMEGEASLAVIYFGEFTQTVDGLNRMNVEKYVTNVMQLHTLP